MGSATPTRLTTAFTDLANGDIDNPTPGQLKHNFKVTIYAYKDEIPVHETDMCIFISYQLCFKEENFHTNLYSTIKP